MIFKVYICKLFDKVFTDLHGLEYNFISAEE